MADTDKIDIVPELLERIQEDFDRKFANDPKLRTISDKIAAGNASYHDVQDFAARTGELLSEALQENISADQLPNGRMYYNIAERVLGTMLRADHDIIAGTAAEVQRSLNERAGLGLRAQTADYDEENAKSIIDKVSAEEDFENVRWMLKAPVENFSMKVVDNTIKKNADFHYNAGLKPRIVRSAESKCCDWCASLEGTYDYPGVPKEVFGRHNNCRCTVDYDPRTGKVQNVWNKKEWKDAGEYDKIEARKEVWPEDDRKNGQDILRALVKESDYYTRRRRTENGQEIIDKATYNKITKSFIKSGGRIIRGKTADEYLAKKNASAIYLPSLNVAIISDNATVSDVLEEMYHAKQDRNGIYATEGISYLELNTRREIDAQRYLISVKDKYKIPQSETETTIENLKRYEGKLKQILEGQR